MNSTGIKFLGNGEWQTRKHGPQGRRQWRKVHLAMNTATSDIRAAEFTPSPSREGDGRSSGNRPVGAVEQVLLRWFTLSERTGIGMLGYKERGQLELFVAGSLRDLIPDDHVLIRVDRVLDLEWLRGEVCELYCVDNGRPGIDPEVAVRLMLAGFLLGIVHDRRLLREAQVNLAIRWFIGYALHEALPEHSSLTRIRQRWSADVFRRIFTRVVRQCRDAGLVTAETVHVDATLIRADVSMDALIERHLDAADAAASEADESERLSRTTGKHKKLCRSDPDATMATASKAPLRPSYKQHTAVDDHAGIVVDVEVVTGEEHDATHVMERLDAIVETLDRPVGRVTADASYGIGRVYAALEERETGYVIPHRKAIRRGDAKGFPVERFKYDARHDVVRCPARKTLTPRNRTRSGHRSTVPTDATAPPVSYARAACPGQHHPSGCTSPNTTPPFCGLGARGCGGAMTSTPSTRATDGALKGPTGPPRPSTD